MSSYPKLSALAMFRNKCIPFFNLTTTLCKFKQILGPNILSNSFISEYSINKFYKG